MSGSGNGEVDVVPPRVLAAGFHGGNQLLLEYSESVDVASATTAGNYTSTFASVLSASMQGERRVLLTFAIDLEPGVYQLEVNNILDRAASPNIIAASSVVTFEVEQSQPAEAVLRSEESGGGNLGWFLLCVVFRRVFCRIKSQ